MPSDAERLVVIQQSLIAARLRMLSEAEHEARNARRWGDDELLARAEATITHERQELYALGWLAGREHPPPHYKSDGRLACK